MIKETIEERLLHLERLILVHAHIYYDLDFNIISDSEYEKFSRELLAIMKQYPKEFKESKYYSYFKDYEGSSMYGTKYPPEIIKVAWGLLHLGKIKDAYNKKINEENNTQIKGRRPKPKTKK